MRFLGLSLLILLCSSGHLVCNALYAESCTGAIKRNAVGIHLGTTYSGVGVYKNQCSLMNFREKEQFPDWLYSKYVLYPKNWWYLNTIEVIPNEQGHKSSPSCVAFTDSGVLIGEAAKAQAPSNPERTVCGILRLIGKKFDDPEVQSLIKSLPYEVVDLENKPHVKVKFTNDEAKLFSAEEICAMMLGKMKEIAEAYLRREITHAAVTLPSYFDLALAQHIVDAGKVVGLNMVYVDTPIWSAKGLSDDISLKVTKLVVYDLGGSTFGASLQIEGEQCRVIASKRDLHLGGDSFDLRIADHFVNLIKNKYKKDLSKDMNALTRLRQECEKAKISLSSRDQVMVKIESLADGIDVFEEPLTRGIFEELNMDLFNRTIDMVKEVIEEGGVEMKDLDDIVLVGGSTQVPKIRHMLKEFFGKEPLNITTNPGEASTYVATITAGWFRAECPKGRFCHFPCVALNPMSVGIETIGGFMARVVKRGICLPKKMSRNVTTYYDGQTTIEIMVFEGEGPLTKDCRYLGRLELSGIQPAPRGEPTIEVSVEVFEDMNILVTVEDKATQKLESINISAGQRCEDNYNSTYYTRPMPGIPLTDSLENAIKMEEIKATMAMFQSQAYSRRFTVVDKEDSSLTGSVVHEVSRKVI